MRWSLFVPLFGAALCFGCQNNPSQHAQKAQEHAQSAQKDVTQAQQSAQSDINKGQREAAGEQQKAEEERAKAEGERQPVAGRLTTLDKDLRDKLGDDWMVQRHGDGWVAIRTKAKKADENLGQKVDDQIKSFRGDHRDAMAMRSGNEVTLRGRIDDCGDAADAAKKFAGIDGINRLVIDVSCTNVK